MTREGPDGARRARRAGIAVFAAIVGAFTVVCSVQIILDVWFAPAAATTTACREGLSTLIHAVRRARRDAHDLIHESEALRRFRASLLPEWHRRGELDLACQADARAQATLRAIDQLRYAEEHAVRYEAQGLTLRRRRVQALERDLGLQSP